MSPDSASGASIQAVNHLMSYLSSQAEMKQARLEAADNAQKLLKTSVPPPPDPDEGLDRLIRKHKLLEYWKCVNVKLHVETVAELAMIAKSLLNKAVPLEEFPAAVK